MARKKRFVVLEGSTKVHDRVSAEHLANDCHGLISRGKVTQQFDTLWHAKDPTQNTDNHQICSECAGVCHTGYLWGLCHAHTDTLEKTKLTIERHSKSSEDNHQKSGLQSLRFFSACLLLCLIPLGSALSPSTTLGNASAELSLSRTTYMTVAKVGPLCALMLTLWGLISLLKLSTDIMESRATPNDAYSNQLKYRLARRAVSKSRAVSRCLAVGYCVAGSCYGVSLMVGPSLTAQAVLNGSLLFFYYLVTSFFLYGAVLDLIKQVREVAFVEAWK